MKSVTRFKNNFRGTVCLNCDQLISEENYFCPNCGQVNDKKPISLKQYFVEYFTGLFDMDNRFFKTIIPLLFRPGRVTYNYIHGKRQSYVNPFQLFLHITILFFLLLGFFSTIDKFNIEANLDKNEELQINKDDALLVFDTIKSSAISEIKRKNPDFDEVKINSQIDSIQGIVQKSLNKTDSVASSKNELLKIHIDSVFKNSDYIEKFKSTKLSLSQKDSIFKSMFDSITNYASILLSGKEDIVVKDWDEFGRINDLKNIALDHIESVFKENSVEYQIPQDLKLNIQNNWALELMEKSSKNVPAFKKFAIFMRYDSENKDVDIA